MWQACQGYVQLSIVLRSESAKKLHPEQHHHDPYGGHTCAHGHTQVAGNEDLQELGGVQLEFDIEVVAVHTEGTYAKETWELSLAERVASVLALKVSSPSMAHASCLVQVCAAEKDQNYIQC